MPPWNNWYHVTIHVYGSWLRGDPRGWRSHHHREHVEGDYKNPPALGTYDTLHQHSKTLMKRAPVRLPDDLRQIVADAMAEKFLQDGIQVLIVSADAKHIHVLGRFPDHNPRHWIGRAKKHTSHLLRQHGHRTEEGGLFAKRSHPEPNTDRAHQIHTLGYILNHAKEGAKIWRFDKQPTKT